jgi:hypothetical protein
MIKKSYKIGRYTKKQKRVRFILNSIKWILWVISVVIMFGLPLIYFTQYLWNI